MVIEKCRYSCMAIVPFIELKHSECGPVSGLETGILCGLNQNKSYGLSINSCNFATRMIDGNGEREGKTSGQKGCSFFPTEWITCLANWQMKHAPSGEFIFIQNLHMHDHTGSQLYSATEAEVPLGTHSFKSQTYEIKNTRREESCKTTGSKEDWWFLWPCYFCSYGLNVVLSCELHGKDSYIFVLWNTLLPHVIW